MLVTLSGMTTDARLLHAANAKLPMLVTFCEMTIGSILAHGKQ